MWQLQQCSQTSCFTVLLHLLLLIIIAMGATILFSHCFWLEMHNILAPDCWNRKPRPPVVSVHYRAIIAQHSAPVPQWGKHCFSICLLGSISPLLTHSPVLLIDWWREVIPHTLRMYISHGCSLNSTIYRALWLWTWDHTHTQRMGWTMEKGVSPAMENTHIYTRYQRKYCNRLKKKKDLPFKNNKQFHLNSGEDEHFQKVPLRY